MLKLFKRITIKVAFQTFYKHFSYLNLEQTIEYFSILGGIEENITIDYFDDIFSMLESNFVDNFKKFHALVSPSYLLEAPYRDVLMSVARGDAKFYSVIRKSKLSQSVGEEIIQELISLNVLSIEKSRETPLSSHPKNKIKKHLRSYRIQDKLRFTQPFMRFWFGFVSYYRDDLIVGRADTFLNNFHKNYKVLHSLVYEQLCNTLLIEYYADSRPLLSSGSYWDQHTEFDILAIRDDKRLILGECKYTNRKVCKNEFTKLKVKANHSGIRVDIYALFSKSGFSNELLGLKSKDLLLFDLDDIAKIIQ